MPGRRDIEAEIEKEGISGCDIVRRKYIAELAAITGRDTVVYAAGLGAKLPSNLPPHLVQISRDDIQGFMAALQGLKGEKLDLILISLGGSAEAAEQIVNYLRSKYSHIRTIIPQNAMSAATMIACASDVLVMGKQSAIGPIDPQITLPTGAVSMAVPAQSILDDFERAKNEVTANPRVAPLWAAKLQSLPHGMLSMCQSVIDRSKLLVNSWLKDYMKLPPADAQRIADWLGNANEHKNHGRPINAELALSKGLKVEKLEGNQAEQDKILDLFHAIMVTFIKTDCVKIFENQQGKGMYFQVQVSLPGIGMPQLILPPGLVLPPGLFPPGMVPNAPKPPVNVTPPNPAPTPEDTGNPGNAPAKIEAPPPA